MCSAKLLKHYFILIIWTLITLHFNAFSFSFNFLWRKQYFKPIAFIHPSILADPNHRLLYKDHTKNSLQFNNLQSTGCSLIITTWDRVHFHLESTSSLKKVIMLQKEELLCYSISTQHWNTIYSTMEAANPNKKSRSYFKFHYYSPYWVFFV